MTDKSIDAALKVLFTSDIGKELLSYAANKITDQNSAVVKTQAGQAGAVPLPDPAPWTGAPHKSPDTIIKPPGGTVRNDNGFHWVNNQTMADLANDSMKDLHGTNGTSYGN